MAVVFDGGVTLVILQGDGPSRDVKGKLAIRTIIVFPTTVRFGKQVVADVLNDILDAAIISFRRGTLPVDRDVRHAVFQNRIIGFRSDRHIFDLAAISATIEGDHRCFDPSSIKAIKQCFAIDCSKFLLPFPIGLIMLGKGGEGIGPFRRISWIGHVLFLLDQQDGPDRSQGRLGSES